MFIVRFERNAKDGLKPKMLMQNDNSHLKLSLEGVTPPAPHSINMQPEEEKKAPVKLLFNIPNGSTTPKSHLVEVTANFHKPTPKFNGF